MFERVRSDTGRIATLSGTAILTGGLVLDPITGPGIVAAVATAGIGLATNVKILRAPSSVKATAACVYAAPHAGCAALLAGERLAPASGAWLATAAGAVALWTGATWWIRPGRLARHLADEAAVQEVAEVAETPPEETTPAGVQDDPAARWWAREVAQENGPAPGTVLLEHQQIGPQCVALIIASRTRGKPVPEISTASLSALLDLDQTHISVGPVPGRGAGVRLVVIGERPQAKAHEMSDEARWKEIAETAMPGVELVDVTTYQTQKEVT